MSGRPEKTDSFMIPGCSTSTSSSDLPRLCRSCAVLHSLSGGRVGETNHLSATQPIKMWRLKSGWRLSQCTAQLYSSGLVQTEQLSTTLEAKEGRGLMQLHRSFIVNSLGQANYKLKGTVTKWCCYKSMHLTTLASFCPQSHCGQLGPPSCDRAKAGWGKSL